MPLTCDDPKSHPPACSCHLAPSSFAQTLDELEFDRSIHSAAISGDVKTVARLAAKGDVDGRDSAGYTALHYASRNGHMEICRLLVQSGADVNARTLELRATPLHRASSAGHLSIVQFLLASGADAFLRDADGKDACQRARESGKGDIVQELAGGKAPR